jgi:DNA-binding transcriptional LysR family regulator
MRGLVVGCVAVGIGPAMVESYVTLAIAQLAEESPQTRITVRVDHWQQLSKWLIAGELDLYVADIADARDDPRTTCISLEPQQIVWFCRAEHPLCERVTVSQLDLLEFPLVTPRMPPWAVRWFAESTHGLDQEDASRSQRSFATVECENYTILKRMVLSSNCISAALRGTLANEVKQGSIVILPVDAPTLVTDAGIVQLSNRTLSPLAAELVAKIHKFASEMALTSKKH